MSIDSIFPDLFDDLGDEGLVLRDKEFIGVDIPHFAAYRHKDTRPVRIENVLFKDCNILSDRISIKGSISLRNVEFIDLSCEEYFFDSSNKLDNVKIKGKKSTLWMKWPIDMSKKGYPDIRGVELEHPLKCDGVCLDLTEFCAELVVYNANPKNIKLNYDWHYIVDARKNGAKDKRITNRDDLAKFLQVMDYYASRSDSNLFISSTIKPNGKVDRKAENFVRELRELGIVD